MRDAAAVAVAAAASFSPSSLRRDRIPTCCRTPHFRLLSHHRQQNHSLVLADSRHQARSPAGGKLSTRCCSSPLRFVDDGQNGGEAHLCGGESSVVDHPFPEETGSTGDACQMFDVLARRGRLSQVTGGDHSRTIRLLCEEGSVEEANRVLREMAELGLRPSLSVYNSVVHALAGEGDFRGAWDAVGRMTEVGLAAVPETYHGLIRAYGNARMYDEMSKCAKAMASAAGRCPPNEVTYNILISEYARGGLLERMEGAHRTLLSKRMRLLPSTLVVMLEAYADLGVLEKMDKACRYALRAKPAAAYLKESLVRKMALVYIRHRRFARLEELGNEIGSTTGRSPLVWCLLLLCSALLSSRKGMESIAGEMRIAKVGPRITFTNIVASAHAKMKSYRDLSSLLSQMGGAGAGVRPDLVTVGILFDACAGGFDGTRVLDAWRRHGFLERRAEVDTDPLVIAAFGKGPFLLRCEERFSSAVGPNNARRKKLAWTYVDLIKLALGGCY